METTKLSALDAELMKSGSYEQDAEKVAKTVRAVFESTNGAIPNEDEVMKHFFVRSYRDFELSAEVDDFSDYDHQEAFYENLSKALFLRFRKSKEAKTSFARAATIAGLLDDSFLKSQLKFYKSLTDKRLEKKLQCERCYENINQMFGKNGQASAELIGVALTLAEDIKDTKRELDLLAKCQYALYELLDNPNAPKVAGRPLLRFHHVALSIGMYLLSKQGDYETGRCWTHFHNGNIYLDFGSEAQHSDGGEGKGHYETAKNEYDAALDLALKNEYWYAVMTMHERLGLAQKNLGHYTLALEHYDKSLDMGLMENIKPLLVNRNKARCLIGLGNVLHTSAPKANGPAYRSAESYLKEACELAHQSDYGANEAVALRTLAELHKDWGNKEEEKHFRELAENVKLPA